MIDLPEPTRDKVQSLVIAGAGLSGWLVAAACAVTLGKSVRITVVGKDEEPEFLPVATAGRRFCEFNQLLRLQEDVFMAFSGAYFRLGAELRTKEGPQCASLGQLGKGSWLAPFYQFWLRGKSLDIAGPLLDYSVESVGARENRYSPLPNYPSEHGYQFDTREYTLHLKKLTLELGAQHIDSGISNVELSEAGIRALALQSGDKVFGDLFVDCTGSQAELIGKVAGEPREDWRQWLPEDSLIATYQPAELSPPLHTPESQNDIGRAFSLFTQCGQLQVQSFSRDSNTWEAALKQLPPELQCNELFRRQDLRPGTYKNMWVKNCVAIGSSAAYVDCHEPTQIQLVYRGILRLLTHFPSAQSYSASRDQFNREMIRELHGMRDNVVLRRLIVDRTFHRQQIPDSLRTRIELFEESGFSECREDELFKENYWAQMLLMAGFVPKQLHPIVLHMDTSALSKLLSTTHQDAQKIAASFSDHAAYTERASKLRSRASAPPSEWRLPSNTLTRSTPGQSDVSVKAVGLRQTPVITISKVGVDWVDSLREHARDLNFAPDRANYYPGTRSNLPNQYVMTVMSMIAKLVSDVYQVPRNLTPNIFQASFSLTTQPEQTLTTAQCIPHFDTTKPYSYAILHYLSPGDHGQTGFFRHLPTGFEYITEQTRQRYVTEIDRYFAAHGQPHRQYMTSSNDHFELYDQITYAQHKLTIYPGNLLHSAMIVPKTDIDADPLRGRLTANIFLEFNP